MRSRSYSDDTVNVWESTADSTFTVFEDAESDLARGTEIALFLKEDATEFCDQGMLKSLVQRFSQFIQFPIYLHESRVDTIEVPAEDDDEDDDDEDADLDDDDEDDEDLDDEDDEDDDEDELDADDEEAEPKMVKKEVTTWEWSAHQRPACHLDALQGRHQR